MWWKILIALYVLFRAKSTPAPGEAVSTPTGSGAARGQTPFIAPTPAGAPSTGSGSAEISNPWGAGQKGFGSTVSTPVQNTIVAPASVPVWYENLGNGNYIEHHTAKGGPGIPGDSILTSQEWLAATTTATLPAAQGSAEVSLGDRFLGPPQQGPLNDGPVTNTTAWLLPAIGMVPPIPEPMIPLDPGQSVTDAFTLPAGKNGETITVEQTSGVSSGVNQ